MFLHNNNNNDNSCMHVKSLQSCPTLFAPMDCSPPGSSIHGILQARILEGLPCPPAGDLPNQGTEPATPVSPTLTGRFFTRSYQGSPSLLFFSPLCFMFFFHWKMRGLDWTFFKVPLSSNILWYIKITFKSLTEISDLWVGFSWAVSNLVTYFWGYKS